MGGCPQLEPPSSSVSTKNVYACAPNDLMACVIVACAAVWINVRGWPVKQKAAVEGLTLVAHAVVCSWLLTSFQVCLFTMHIFGETFEQYNVSQCAGSDCWIASFTKNTLCFSLAARRYY